jgi:hypothetical protein
VEQPAGPWIKLKQELTRLSQVQNDRDREALKTSIAQGTQVLPVPMQKLIQAEVGAILQGKPAPAVTAADLHAVLEVMETSGYYDQWLAAWLWRKTAGLEVNDDRRTVELLFARLEQHARLTNALIRAQAQIKPVQLAPQPWRNKGGPPRGMSWSGYSLDGLKDLAAAVKQLYPASDSGTWRRDGVALLTVAKDSPKPTLLRGGKKHVLDVGETVRFGRLDLIQTPEGDKPVVLDHAWLGPITLPAGKLISVWELARLLSPDARATVGQAVTQALANKEEAADKLEQALPLAHALLREGLKRNPDAKGAPRLRLILALFDDAVMPALVIDPNVKPQIPGGPGGAR